MTGPAREHARFDELAAGYALHALEPDDEREFRSHLPSCSRCQDALGDFTEVTAALAGSWPETELAEPGRHLGERIMAAVAGEAASGAGQSPGSSRRGGQDEQPAAAAADLTARRRPRRLTMIIASAAAAVVLVGGAIWAGLSASGTGAPQRPAAGCVRAGECRQVVLAGARSHDPVARVIVAGGTAWVVPSGLAADNTARQIYVLWQIAGAHAPVAVGSFDVRRPGTRAVRIGRLAVPYRSTRAFAVSIEAGRAVPAAPSNPVALGQVAS